MRVVIGLVCVILVLACVVAQAIDSEGREDQIVTMHASITRIISYQGILKNGAGNPVSDNTYNVTFRIYNSASGGSSLWSSPSIPVTTVDGIFVTEIGPITLAFDTTYYLSLQVSPDPEMVQRQMLTMSAYSAVSDTANYAFKADTASNVPDNSITSAKIVNGTIQFGDIGQNSATNGQVMKWNGSAWVARNDSVGGGGSSYWILSGNILSTNDYWAINKGATGNALYGSNAKSMVNLGVACTTGTSGQNYSSCTVGGGVHNIAGGSWTTVSGGENNTAGANHSNIGGGVNNTASDLGATIAGGARNSAGGYCSSVGGGDTDTANGTLATIGGGYYNDARGHSSGVSSGRYNQAGDADGDTGAVVAGGSYNSALEMYATVGGGLDNSISAGFSTIAGGAHNQVTNGLSSLGGGNGNIIWGGNATIGGGYHNSITANGNLGTIGGGDQNTVDGQASTIAGGSQNFAAWAGSTIGGGQFDSVTNIYATVSGGYGNNASGQYSSIAGGSNNSARGNRSVVGGGGLNRANDNCDIVAGGSGNYAAGGFSVVSGGQGDTASGTCSTVSGGSSNRAKGHYSGVLSGYNNFIAEYATSSVLAGGGDNHAESTYCTIGGGQGNFAIGHFATIAGGWLNRASYLTAIGGGRDNQAYGMGSVVAGGIENEAWNATICGGRGNTTNGVFGNYMTICGGLDNQMTGSYSFIGGGEANACDGQYSSILGGYGDTLNVNASSSLAFGRNIYSHEQYHVIFFNSRYPGKLRINRDSYDGSDWAWPIMVGTNTSNGNGAYLSAGGVWTNGSGMLLDTNRQRLDGAELLFKISSLSITSNFNHDSFERHIGPSSTDFARAFDVGACRDDDGKRDDQGLAASDVAGVALAGVQELLKKIETLEKRIAELEAERGR